MKKNKGKFLAVGLAMILCLAILPVTAFAGEPPAGDGYAVNNTTYTYDGQPHALDVAAEEGVALYYSLSADSGWQEEPIAATNAGDTTVYVKAEWEGAPLSGPTAHTLTINKANVGIQISYQTGTAYYLGAERPFYNNSAFYGEPEPTVEPRILDMDNGNAELPADTLDYTVTRTPSQYNYDNALTLKPGTGKTTVTLTAGSEKNANYNVKYLNVNGVNNAYTYNYVLTNWLPRAIDYSSVAQSVEITYGDPVPNMPQRLSPYNIGGILEEDLDLVPYNINQFPQNLITSLPKTYKPETNSWTWSWQQGTGTDISLLVPDTGPENRLGAGDYGFSFNVNNATGSNFSGTAQVKQNNRYQFSTAGTYWLSINQKPVTLTADSGTKVYGEADPAFTGGNTATAYGETIDYHFTRAAGEKVGEYAVTQVVDKSQYPNYKITDEPGTFSITPRQLVLVGGSGTVPYNAATQSLDNFTVRNLASGDRLVSGVSYNAARRDAGAQQGVFTVDGSKLKIVNKNGEDVTNCYTIAQTSGVLTVEPIPATVYVDSFAKTSAELDPEFTGRVEGLLAGDTLGRVSFHRADASVAATAVGTFPLTATYGANPNYTVNLVPGELVVTGAPVITPLVVAPGPIGPVEPPEPPEAVIPLFEADTPVGGPEADPEPVAVNGPQTPVAGIASYWALLNLVIAVLALLMGIVLIVGFFRRREREEAEEDEQQARIRHMRRENGEEVEEPEDNLGKTGLVWRILAIIAGILSPVVFLLTENVRLPMIFVDRWTLLMVILLAVQLVLMLILRKVRQPIDQKDKNNNPPAQAL